MFVQVRVSDGLLPVYLHAKLLPMLVVEMSLLNVNTNWYSHSQRETSSDLVELAW